jgi:hypothetical protein
MPAKGYEAVRRVAVAERPLGGATLAGAAVVLGVAALLIAVPPTSSAARWLLAGITALVLAFVCLRSTVQGLFLTFAWLLMVGLTRRLASEVLADPARDPFVLVGVVAMGVLTARALLAGALRHRTMLANALLVFSALVVLEMLNPDQPSGLSRVAGLLVWLVPTLWFWVGRSFVGDQLASRLLVAVSGTALLTAIYGIGQSVTGFPPWDQRWLNLHGYSSLFIGPGTWRPFGTYASATEFALACAVTAVVAATAFFGPRFLRYAVANESGQPKRARWIAVLALAAFLIASLGLVLSAIRTSLVLLVVALPTVYLVMYGRRAWRVLVPALLLAVLALATIAQVNPDDIGRSGSSAAIRRVVVALHDPFVSNEENHDNTLQIHYDSARHGIEEAFRVPLGQGTGATGIAGEHFGAKGSSTDFDISDAGLAFGIAGLLMTLAIVGLAFTTAVRVALRRRTFERVALVGVMIVSIGAWWQGAHYAMAPLLWLFLGRADAVTARESNAEEAEDVAASAEPDVTGEIPETAP